MCTDFMNRVEVFWIFHLGIVNILIGAIPGQRSLGEIVKLPIQRNPVVHDPGLLLSVFVGVWFHLYLAEDPIEVVECPADTPEQFSPRLRRTSRNPGYYQDRSGVSLVPLEALAPAALVKLRRWCSPRKIVDPGAMPLRIPRLRRNR